jgi:methionyl-tRNA synthetase
MDRPPFYVTTPIYYVSDVPHLGHAYTTVVADALARHHRLRGDDTRFLTGTDDHGQKIERMAAERGKPPKAYADEIAAAYRAMWSRLGVSNDDFLRTTDADHEAVVQELWRRMVERGDIYLGDYEGWYCVACEQFYTEKELEPGNVCAVHKKPVEKVKEQGYFFRLSQYQRPLLELYDRVRAETGRPFIEPVIRMNEVRAFVEGGLEDLSVSRSTFSWGVPVPGGPGSVIYVWIDALTNYYSATRRHGAERFWDDPRTEIVHLMGKEITRFHAVYWPAVLLSAGLRTPSRIVAHGWWTVDGEKMSKTRGNVVDPMRLVDDLGDTYGVGAFRYFVMREVPLGADGDFSHEALLQRYNAELANDLGNLLNRTLGMVGKYLGADVTWRQLDDEQLRARAAAVVKAVDNAMLEFQPSRALEEVWSLVRLANGYIEAQAPWKQTKPDQEVILWNALETCRIIAHLVEPFMPERAAEMRRQVGRADEQPQLPRWESGKAFRVVPGAPLFPRVDEDRRKELLARWAPKPAAPQQDAAAAQKGGAASQQAPAASQHEPAATQLPSLRPQGEASRREPGQIAYDDFARLDLRVAAIAAAERVPKKDKLLKLTVDLGGERRQVVAGIAAAYAPEQLVGRRVIFLANLKPAKIGGVVSEGMILAAGDAEILALSALDRDCPLGTRVR